MQPVPDEPPEGQVDLALTHQAAIVDDAQQEPREHEADGDFRIDAGPAIVRTIEISNFVAKP
jgi:hypothetical protein